MSHDLDLYSLLPLIVRAQSLLSNGLLDEDDTTPSIFKKIVYALEQEANTTADEIEGLSQLVDPDSSPVQYLPLLASLVSAPYEDTWSDEKRRVVLRGIMFVWLTKGLRSSWGAFLNLYGYGDQNVFELFKSVENEVDDYSIFQDAGHPLRAARVGFSSDPNALSPGFDTSFIDELLLLLEPVRPIHVLGIRTILSGDPTIDYLEPPCEGSCQVSCEAACEMGAETGEVDPDFATITSSFVDTLTTPTDTCSVLTTCISWCQAQCEAASCEGAGCQGGGCETGCEALCETVCQTGCTTACETVCQMTCQLTGCQLNCELLCQATCQLGCELFCETDCEVGTETIGA